MKGQTRGEPPDGVPVLWRVKQVAEALAVSEPTVYRLMESGKLPYVRFGRSRRVRKSDVLKLLEESTVTRA